MELLLKSAAAALTAAFAGLLIRKNNPELTLLLGVCACVSVLLAAAGFASVISDLADAVRKYTGASDTLVVPVIKCLVIALTTRIASELCRDASQSSAAYAVEMAGSICALCVAAPLLMSMLSMLSSIV